MYDCLPIWLTLQTESGYVGLFRKRSKAKKCSGRRERRYGYVTDERVTMFPRGASRRRAPSPLDSMASCGLTHVTAAQVASKPILPARRDLY